MILVFCLFVLWDFACVCALGGGGLVFQNFVSFQNDSRNRYYVSMIYYPEMQG